MADGIKLLVTGRNGQVARSLADFAGPSTQVITIGRPDLDITDRESIERAIAAHRPHIVVNAAAFTAVDKAETDSEAAFAANRDGAGNVASVAAAMNLPLIHLSTDYVFAGDKVGAYSETDPTDPKSIYGHSKLQGETAVAAANAAHAIFRTAWVYSPYGANFLKTMLRLAGERDTVRVVADQHGNPTYAPDIAKAILIAAKRIVDAPDKKNWRGVFHVVAAGDATWAGFADEVFRQSAMRGGPQAGVEPITTSEYPTAAKRPANSRLDMRHFHATFGHSLPDWRDGVTRCLDRLASERLSFS